MTKFEAYKHLTELDQSTVIDPDWFSFFYDSQTLLALLTLGQFRTYEQIVYQYEGHTLKEYITACISKELKEE